MWRVVKDGSQWTNLCMVPYTTLFTKQGLLVTMWYSLCKHNLNYAHKTDEMPCLSPFNMADTPTFVLFLNLRKQYYCHIIGKRRETVKNIPFLARSDQTHISKVLCTQWPPSLSSKIRIERKRNDWVVLYSGFGIHEKQTLITHCCFVDVNKRNMLPGHIGTPKLWVLAVYKCTCG